MSSDNQKIKELQARLEKLSSYSSALNTEIENLRKDLHSISGEMPSQAIQNRKQTAPSETKQVTQNTQSVERENEQPPALPTREAYVSEEPKAAKKKFDIEKLIGENLINKIGILITVIGVGIGAKYSIDNNLISPVMRIVLGYLSGVILLGIGMKLKAKYTNYSAVLVSGAMAIMYFITFFAYSFYDLMGQEIAFGLMAIFTVFTVLAALQYDRQIIAFFGMIGAYAVPFLLSDGSGNDVFFLSYIALVNSGILFISAKKYWRRLFYVSFFFTYLIFMFWLSQSYDKETDFALAIGFLTLFFLMFYAIFLVYKIVNQKKFTFGDIIFMLLNSFLYFGIGYGLIYGYSENMMQLALFALANAAIHYFVANLINSKKLSDNNIFYLVVGLVITFITIAIPIALDGNWVTMIWAIEAALLFWIGRTRGVPFYEYLSFICVAVMLGSLTGDWDSGYRIRSYAEEIKYYPSIFNMTFLSSIVAVGSLGFISWLFYKKEYWTEYHYGNRLVRFFKYALPVLFLGTLFFAFEHEIGYYFDKLYQQSKLQVISESTNNSMNIFNVDFKNFKSIWMVNFAMLFLSGLCFLWNKYLKNRILYWVLAAICGFAILFFLTESLFVLSDLRGHYIDQYQGEYYTKGLWHVIIRYVSLLCFGLLIWMTYRLLSKIKKNDLVNKIIEVVFYLIGLWVASSELLHWMEFVDGEKASGVALTILWGLYALCTIVIGIWHSKKHLRILGFGIFAITLIKLVFFDLAHLSTIYKTIVLVSLGVLLLITSFLYNKYTISDEEVQD